MKFNELGLSDDILSAITFEESFPIQAKVIPLAVKGRDVIGQARTGSGKTLAYGLPIVERLSGDAVTQALVLVPTRELAVQVNKEVYNFARVRGLKSLAVYGGVSFDEQAKFLTKGTQIVVGTPGRIIDHLNRGTLKLDSLKMLVLDEADRMLDMGFMEDVEYIISAAPKDRQTMLFSATIPDVILELSTKYMKETEFINDSHDDFETKHVKQYYLDVQERGRKASALTSLIKGFKGSTLVFCNSIRCVQFLERELYKRGVKAAAIYGKLSQNRREQVIKDFKRGAVNTLIATNVASRGLDMPITKRVINYDVPEDPKDYVHRIGRTSRGNSVGEAITIISNDVYNTFSMLQERVCRDIQPFNF